MAEGAFAVYDFYLSWFVRTLRRAARDATHAPSDLVRGSLETSRWTPQASYRFWEGVAEGFLHFVTAGFLVLFGVMLAFQPTGTAHAVGLFVIRAWGAFFFTGFVLIAVPYFRVWFRRRAGEALPPRTSGWWMLLIQVPAAAAFALASR